MQEKHLYLDQSPRRRTCRLNNLANLYLNTSCPAEAEPLHQCSIAILEKALPPDYPHRMRGWENYIHLGRHAEVAELCAQAQAIR